MAAPHAAGACAILKRSAPTASADEILDRASAGYIMGNGFANLGFGLPARGEGSPQSSCHTSGFMVAFADGHVRLISENIAYEVYMHLMTSNGQKYQPAGVRA